VGYNAVADDTAVIFFRLADVASKICKISRNLREFELMQVKVIQGHWFWCQSKAHIRPPITH